MDIALVLDKIRPKAAWRMADTYENLKSTWEDKEQSLPTENEIQTAWENLQKTIEPTKEKKLAALDAVYQPQFVALAQALGLATLDANQTVIDGVKADYAALKAEYQAKVKEIG